MDLHLQPLHGTPHVSLLPEALVRIELCRHVAREDVE